MFFKFQGLFDNIFSKNDVSQGTSHKIWLWSRAGRAILLYFSFKVRLSGASWGLLGLSGSFLGPSWKLLEIFSFSQKLVFLFPDIGSFSQNYVPFLIFSQEHFLFPNMFFLFRETCSFSQTHFSFSQKCVSFSQNYFPFPRNIFLIFFLQLSR